MVNFERRFIIARCGLNLDKRICFLVLEDKNDELLCVTLDYFVLGDNPRLKLKSENYSFLFKDSISNGFVSIIKKENILFYSKELISDVDCDELLNSLKFSKCFLYNTIASLRFKRFLNKYYRNLLKVGSVVTVRVNKDLFKCYYVCSLEEEYFKAIQLNYEGEKGLFLDDVNVLNVTYRSVYDSIFYDEGLAKRINGEIEAVKMLRKK